MIPNYYKILDLKSDCSATEIKRAFKKIVFKVHPDINKSEDAHEQFVSLYEAYSILIEPNLRAKYDLIYSEFYLMDKDIVKCKNGEYDCQDEISKENDLSSIIHKVRKDGIEYSHIPLSQILNELKIFGSELIFHLINTSLYFLGYSLILMGIGGFFYALLIKEYYLLFIGLFFGFLGKVILSKTIKRWDKWDIKNN